MVISSYENKKEITKLRTRGFDDISVDLISK